MVENILSLNPQQVIEKEKEIIGTYPNTYTFTKSLAERTLQKKHGKLRLLISRPSIVISALKEPLEGWTETLSAGGGLIFAAMIGMVNYIYCSNPNSKLDMIPCDYVSNMIIVATAYTG